MFVALDHVALAVHDLASAARSYENLLGCPPSWRATSEGAEYARFQLPNTALEIIAPAGAGEMGQRVRQHLANHEPGLFALALATPDLAEAQRRLGRRAVTTSEARQMVLTGTDTGQQHERQTVLIEPNVSHGVLLFVVDRSDEARSLPSDPQATERNRICGLDHVVITTAQPDRAVAFYGARLGLDLALDRTNAAWKARLLFFRCGDLIIEVAHGTDAPTGDASDRAWGLSWRVADIHATRERLINVGFDLSEVRAGRKPGTEVCTVRNAGAGVPTILVSKAGGNRHVDSSLKTR